MLLNNESQKVSQTSSRSSQLFEAFAERLYTREKVSLISMELKELEELIFCRIAKEVPDLYRQLSIEHYDKRGQRQVQLGRSHKDVIDGTLTQARDLREMFSKYDQHRNKTNSFSKLVEGIQRDVNDAIVGGKALSTTQNPSMRTTFDRRQSSDTNQDDYTSVRNLKGNNNDSSESTILAIRMGSVANQSSGNKQNNDSGESFMVQIMRQQEQEISKCNALVNKLRGEGADMQQTIYEQRQEIQNLLSQLKEQTLRIEEVSEVSLNREREQKFNRREAENMIKRLKEEIRDNHLERNKQRRDLQESTEAVANLQNQITSLKHKLNATEGAKKNQHSQDLAVQLSEMADLKKQNSDAQEKYNEMAKKLHSKEMELVDMEEKSKQMLITAQRDAQECIKYFKGLAHEAQLAGRERPPQRNQSHSPAICRWKKPEPPKPNKNNVFMNELVKSSNQMPKSLAPMPSGKHQQRRSHAFDRDRGEYNVNGIKLRTKQRAASSIETQATGGFVHGRINRRHQRAQTLSPTISHDRKQNVSIAEINNLTNHKFKASHRMSQERDESTFSGHGNDLNEADLGPNVGDRATLIVSRAERHLSFLFLHLGKAYDEIVDQKRVVSKMVTAYGEQYCQQLQKFSVLAYDYLERIENLTKREGQIENELSKQSDMIDQLKSVAARQSEHIRSQSEFIVIQKNQLALQVVSQGQQNDQSVKSALKIGSLIKEEIPKLQSTIQASQSAITNSKQISQKEKTNLHSTKHLLDLSKKKVKILEEELEKSLEFSQKQEKLVHTTRKKFNQLVDLIKDIWQIEVQNSTLNPVMNQSLHSGQQYHQNTHDQHYGLVPRHGGDAASDMTQTINSGPAIDVPMPISWLADISDHIKQLKEMNDFQMDEVFRIVNMLHQEKKPDEEIRRNAWPSNEDSFSTEEDDQGSSSHLSEQRMKSHVAPPEFHQRVSVVEEQKQYFSNRNHRHQRSAPSQTAHIEQDKISEAERTLEQYDQQARILRQQSVQGLPVREMGSTDDGDLYVNTTSVSKKVDPTLLVDKKNQKELTSDSPDRQEMSFSQCLDDPVVQSRESQHKNRLSERVVHRSGSHGDTYRRESKTHKLHDQQQQSLTGGRSKRDRSHQPSHKLEWPELGGVLSTAPDQQASRSRIDAPYRRSLHLVSSKRRRDGGLSFSGPRDSAVRSTHRRPALLSGTYAATHHQGYRASIDMTATCGTLAMDAAKRNELYIMLREEVETHLQQTEVNKETVLGMKRLIKQKRKEQVSADQAYRHLYDEKQGLLDANEQLENEAKEYELQIEELQNIIQDRENSMETLKAQIEDFEKELLGLQDQMTHVMKLNAEIGAASEHWQLSYRDLQEQQSRDKQKMREEFNKTVAKKIEKIKLYKRKLQEKECSISSIGRELRDAITYREELESRRRHMSSVQVQTEPVLELLEQHKAILEDKLTQVKQDVSTVLDQVDREHTENDEIRQRLFQQKETNKSLVAELDTGNKKVADFAVQNSQLQSEIRSLKNEINLMTQSMKTDQEQYQGQIKQAEVINADLQKQVDQVTKAAEELQENYIANENLQRNIEVQEQKIGELEEQLISLQGQVNEKDRQIANLEESLIGGGSSQEKKNKRESRSVSLPRQAKVSAQGPSPSPHLTRRNTKRDNHDPVNHLSQILPGSRNEHYYVQNSSVSRSSFIASREAKNEPARDNEENIYQVDDLNNTLQTNQSEFDHAEEEASFHRPPDRHHQHYSRPNKTTQGELNNQSSRDYQGRRLSAGLRHRDYGTKTTQASMHNLSTRRRESRKNRPPHQFNAHQQHQQQSIQTRPMTAMTTTHGDSTTVHWRCASNDGTNSRNERSECLLDGNSTDRNLAKNKTAATTKMAQSQMIGCCCGASQCMNTHSLAVLAAQNTEFVAQQQRQNNDTRQHNRKFSRTAGFGKQTAIDDLQQCYNQLKTKNETRRESKRKLRKALRMIEILVKHYLNEAMERTEQSTTNSRADDISKYSTVEQLRKELKKMEEEKNEGRIVTEDQFCEAQAYFQKRNQNVVNCLKALVERVTPISTQGSVSDHLHSQSVQTNNYQSSEMTVTKQFEDREPPQIVSGRGQIMISNQVSQSALGDTQITEQREEDVSSNEISNRYDNEVSNTNLQNAHALPQNQTTDNDQKVNAYQSPQRSPQTPCQHCTATYSYAQQTRNDMLAQYKILMQKFMQTGRSLVGICYGGAMFMPEHQLEAQQRTNVEYAMSFLAKDSSEFEFDAQTQYQPKQNLEELWTVFDNLLTCLSKIVSGACHGIVKAQSNINQVDSAPKEKYPLDSIQQKSMDLSTEKNHAISKIEQASFNELDQIVEQKQNAQILNTNLDSSMGTKMLELEQRIRNKFGSIRGLETLLDTILGKQRNQIALLPQLVGDQAGLQKVFLGMRRAVSKLKIDLHQDYLQLSQINLQFQAPTPMNITVGSSKADPNASLTMNNTIDGINQNTNQSMSRNHQDQGSSYTVALNKLVSHSASLDSNNLYFQGTKQRDTCNSVESIGSARQPSSIANSSLASIPQLQQQKLQQQIQIGSCVLNDVVGDEDGNSGAASARESYSPCNVNQQVIIGHLPLQQHLSYSGKILPPHHTTTMDSRERMYPQNSSMGIAPSQTVKFAGPNILTSCMTNNSSQPIMMNSARVSSSNSGKTTTFNNVSRNSNIDRIVEELQGLTTFEYSHGTASASYNLQTASSNQLINKF